MKAIIFDVDDTLYDQLVPFQRAIQQQFSIPDEQMAQLYLAFRQISDANFHASERGDISMEDMRVLRIQGACEQFGYRVTRDQALTFQNDYARFQGEIVLTEEMQEVLTFCVAHNIPIGIITNGPTEHQWKKIHQLGLLRYIPKESIFISAEVRVAKPDTLLFRHVEQQLGMTANQMIYVGDSYENDIVGAKNAGWQAIWLNRRQHVPTEASARQDYLITTESIVPLIKQIIENLI